MSPYALVQMLAIRQLFRCADALGSAGSQGGWLARRPAKNRDERAANSCKRAPSVQRLKQHASARAQAKQERAGKAAGGQAPMPKQGFAGKPEADQAAAEEAAEEMEEAAEELAERRAEV